MISHLCGIATLICCLAPDMIGDLERPQYDAEPSRFTHYGYRVRGQRVLYIGDSLSVGPFGDVMENSLVTEMGRDHVWFYASCGSSLHSWLASEPVYVTPCGYRESTPAGQVLDDFYKGQKPKGSPTPKIEQLLADIQPDIVIVQLGTNHFDILKLGGTTVLPKQAKLFDRFAQTIRKFDERARSVVWIAPPDCASFPDSITSHVKNLIDKTAAAHNFRVIDSKLYTHYVKGKTGRDGVHYAKEEAVKWGNHVVAELNTLLPPQPH